MLPQCQQYMQAKHMLLLKRVCIQQIACTPPVCIADIKAALQSVYIWQMRVCYLPVLLICCVRWQDLKASPLL